LLFFPPVRQERQLLLFETFLGLFSCPPEVSLKFHFLTFPQQAYRILSIGRQSPRTKPCPFSLSGDFFNLSSRLNGITLALTDLVVYWGSSLSPGWAFFYFLGVRILFFLKNQRSSLL